MSQSATPATQSDMTTCLETFEKERFCSFPHRHSEATGKPETRDETRWSIRSSISCETSSNFHTLKLQTRRFPASFLMNLQICYLKIDVSCEASVNFHRISHLSPLDAALTLRFAQSTQHDTFKALGLPRKVTTIMSKVPRLPRKPEFIFWKRRKSIVPATQNCETRLNVTKGLPRETKQRDMCNL